MKTIQYDETLQEYQNALINTLRGFTPKYDFITSWVPDADLQRSVISLVEAAFAEQEYQFRLSFFKATLSAVERQVFEQRLADIAEFSVEEGESEIHYFFQAMKAVDRQHSFKQNQAFKPEKVHQRGNQDGETIINSDDIYQKQIAAYAQKALPNQQLVANDGEKLLTVDHDKASMQFLLNDKNIVTGVAYQGEFTLSQCGILEAAAQLFMHRPVEDIRDNGLALVEYHLRENKKQRKMAGIQVHFNFSAIFEQLQIFISLLTKELTLRPVNFYDIRNQLSWDDVYKERVKAKLNQCIATYLTEHQQTHLDVEIEKIDDNARVTLMVGGECSAENKAALLMDLEIYVRAQLEPALQLYSTPYVDRNTKRKGHQWAINL